MSDSIMFYDQQLRYLLVLYDDERSIRNDFRLIVSSAFDGRVLYDQIDKDDITHYNRPESNPSLLLEDKGSVNRLISTTQFLKTVIRGVRSRQERIRDTAIRLLSFLQTEYHLN